MTWLYLLKERNEVFSCFKYFYNEITTQYSTVLKVLRTDNALEYMSESFQAYLRDKDIIHETSCSHTPRQNGAFERKHRHHLEVTRCLLINMSVPKSYWPQALLTACFLINRMCSSSLKNIQFLVLNPTKTLYPLKPRVFGCICFVHIFTGCKDKLSPKAVKCIFLGYSKKREGYFFYYPTTKSGLYLQMLLFFRIPRSTLKGYPDLAPPLDHDVCLPLSIGQEGISSDLRYSNLLLFVLEKINLLSLPLAKDLLILPSPIQGKID